MKQKTVLFFIALFICAAQQLTAQTDHTTDSVQSSGKNKKSHARNFVKLNLTGLPLKNYSLQYERVLNRKFSFAISFRMMPETSIPFKNKILKIVGDDDPDTKEVIENFRMSNFAITPELRLYLSKKGYGRGFYIAPFYRYASFKTNQMVFTYEDNTGAESKINLSGKLTSNTGGLMFGAQWLLGRRVCLDWWILGPHFGSGTGDFVGTTTQPMDQSEQDDLRQELEDLDIPFTDKTVSVNANGASMKLSGPWGGIRAGISLGIRF